MGLMTAEKYSCALSQPLIVYFYSVAGSQLYRNPEHSYEKRSKSLSLICDKAISDKFVRESGAKYIFVVIGGAIDNAYPLFLQSLLRYGRRRGGLCVIGKVLATKMA